MRRWVDSLLGDAGIRRVYVFSSPMAQYVAGKLSGDVQLIVDFVDVDSAKWRHYAERKRWPASWVYHREGESIHYSSLAEDLGVGNVTAYEMLRLLEDQGLVQSEFHRPETRSGPGRSTVVFRPTPLAVRTLADLAGGDWDEEEWEQAKTRILEQLQAGKVSGYETLLNEILARIPDQRSPVIYLTEMITATILGLHSLKDTAETHRLMRILRNLGLPGEVGLSALTGFSASLSLVERVNRHMASVFGAPKSPNWLGVMKSNS